MQIYCDIFAGNANEALCKENKLYKFQLFTCHLYKTPTGLNCRNDLYIIIIATADINIIIKNIAYFLASYIAFTCF